jgi:serine/threonine protein kinase
MAFEESKAASIFLEAIEIHEPAQQAEYVRQAAAGDPALVERVGALLEGHAQANPILDEARLLEKRLLPTDGSSPALTIGPYKLLEQIGEGGMGLVFMAEQMRPVRRRVALKILKPGMDTRQVVARFEAERQALALMDHPNISKVFDGGTTGARGQGSEIKNPGAGRPYFVMELVRGTPITEYCDTHRLTTHQRLKLFLDVCHAVQHAHQKGIIHRDLKPTNVLVTQHDTMAVPKIIDFGIAKATIQPLTDRTLFTNFAQMVGTPLYMSPEQAEMNGLDVDTRTDVYALGVMLYELLTGTTPFESDTLKKVGLDEMRRMIREDEPPTPSRRWSTLSAQKCSTISERRGVDGRKLGQVLRGELDWIVMKALEKDRDRRYESARAFAADVQRYLDDEAVEACPPTASYRLRKYFWRNRRVLAPLLMVVGVLLVATGVSAWQALRAHDAQRQAEANSRAARRAVDKMYLQVAEKWLGRQPLMDQVQKDFIGEVLRFYQEFSLQETEDGNSRFETAMANQRAGIILNYAFSEKTQAREALLRARDILEKLLKEYRDDPEYLFELAHTYAKLAHTRHLDSAHKNLEEEDLRQSARLLETLITRFPMESRYRAALARSLANLCAPMCYAGRWSEVSNFSRQALALLEPLIKESSNPEHLEPMGNAYFHLALALTQEGNLDEAIKQERNAIVSYERLAKDATAPPEYQHGLNAFNWHMLARCYRDLAQLLVSVKDIQGAEKAFERALGIYLRLVADFPSMPDFQESLASCHGAFGNFCMSQKRLAEAETQFRKASKLEESLRHTVFGAAYPDRLDSLKHLAQIYVSIGQYREAVALQQDVLDTYERQYGPDHPDTISALNDLADVCQRAGLSDRAITLAKQVLEKRETTQGPSHPDTVSAMHSVACTYLAAGRFEESIAWHQTPLKAMPENDRVLKTYARALQGAGKFEEADCQLRKALGIAQGRSDRTSREVGVAQVQTNLALNLLLQGRYLDAESMARPPLELAKRLRPDSWDCFHGKSLVGGALLGQHRYAEAEPFLVEGYEGMRQREQRIHPTFKLWVSKAGERLVSFYEATNQPEKAHQIREEMRLRDSETNKVQADMSNKR